MSLIRINLRDLPLDKPLDFDVLAQNHSLMLPKGRVLTWDLVEKLSETMVFVEGFDSDTDGVEGADIVSNVLASMELGKEVQSMYVIARTGDKFQLQPAQYIGWVKNLAIVAEFPRIGSNTGARIVQMEPGQKIQAKIHSGKFEYVFQSYVMCVTNNPLPHMFIKHPAKVKVVVLRNADRKECNIRAHLVVEDKNQTLNVTIIDISDSGAAIYVDSKLNLDWKYKLKIDFEINGLAQSINVPCEIKNEKATSLKIRYGLAFVKDLAVKEKVFLQSYIYTL